MTDIERRLQAVEDRLAIYQIVCGYGYAADSCNTDVIASLFSEDSVYDIGGALILKGREQIANITKAEGHLALVNAGVAHVATLPYVVIDGDRAAATFHTMVLRKTEDGFKTWRAGACRMELTRQPDGAWKIDHRVIHPQDGSSPGPALLARLQETPAG